MKINYKKMWFLLRRNLTVNKNEGELMCVKEAFRSILIEMANMEVQEYFKEKLSDGQGDLCIKE